MGISPKNRPKYSLFQDDILINMHKYTKITLIIIAILLVIHILLSFKHSRETNTEPITQPITIDLHEKVVGEETIIVDREIMKCMGAFVEHECWLINGEWNLERVRGYQHREGTKAKLRVYIIDRGDIQDAGRYQYVLKEIIEIAGPNEELTE